MAKLNITYKDYSNESSTLGLDAADITDGAGYTAFLAGVTPAITAHQGLTLGAQVRRTILADTTDVSNPLPTNPYAQRELKWYIPLVSVAGVRRGYTIPVARLEGASDSLVVPGSDLANLTAAEWAAFTAWLAGDNIFFPGYTLDGTPYLVGRNI